MMKQVVFSSFLVLMLGQAAQAQQNTADPVFLAKTKVMVKEIFKDCPTYYGDEYVAQYAVTLSRFTIGTQPVMPAENFPLLSSVPLVGNKCNPALSRDQTFDPVTFNPLKYFFDYRSTGVKKYRVDNTNYIISIAPQP
ncbi:hypothetical protein [Taibaiella chishuiensis]|uniref:Uncharacterized protein n=1 Tax=Taibaiella chishuiensis TaxID=1434707 RepID=A0A2P8D9H2_9BACT|nr:hypothetical protein [Taibaiella chishuiensis]PSK93875.1 hypothetical protein B0I18_10123 [Taibaiella chishuiensis]